MRAALADLERAGREPMSKEQAASLVEKALHEAFGEVPEDDESDGRARCGPSSKTCASSATRPSSGEYEDRVKDLAARAAAVVRRWA